MWSTNFVCRDSLMFLTNSLESLVQSLRKTNQTQFTHYEPLIGLKKLNADYKLFFRKDVFFNEHLELFENYNESALSNRDAFLARCEKKSAQWKILTTRARVDSFRMPLSWRLFQALLGERRMLTSSRLRKLPQQLLPELQARHSILCLGASAHLAWHVQNAGP